MKRKPTMRHFVYLTIGLALLFYALPHLPSVTMSLAGAFTLVWLTFALLIIGANLYHLIGADRETSARRSRAQWLRQKRREMERTYGQSGARRPQTPEKKRRFMS